jgi:hypothetical protein
MLAVKLLNAGLGLFALGFVLIAVPKALGHDDSVALAVGLLMPYLGILTLLLAGLCGLVTGARWAGRTLVARDPRHRPFA